MIKRFEVEAEAEGGFTRITLLAIEGDELHELQTVRISHECDRDAARVIAGGVGVLLAEELSDILDRCRRPRTSPAELDEMLRGPGPAEREV